MVAQSDARTRSAASVSATCGQSMSLRADFSSYSRTPPLALVNEQIVRNSTLLEARFTAAPVSNRPVERSVILLWGRPPADPSRSGPVLPARRRPPAVHHGEHYNLRFIHDVEHSKWKSTNHGTPHIARYPWVRIGMLGNRRQGPQHFVQELRRLPQARLGGRRQPAAGAFAGGVHRGHHAGFVALLAWYGSVSFRRRRPRPPVQRPGESVETGPPPRGPAGREASGWFNGLANRLAPVPRNGWRQAAAPASPPRRALRPRRAPPRRGVPPPSGSPAPSPRPPPPPPPGVSKMSRPPSGMVCSPLPASRGPERRQARPGRPGAPPARPRAGYFALQTRFGLADTARSYGTEGRT